MCINSTQVRHVLHGFRVSHCRWLTAHKSEAVSGAEQGEKRNGAAIAADPMDTDAEQSPVMDTDAEQSQAACAGAGSSERGDGDGCRQSAAKARAQHLEGPGRWGQPGPRATRAKQGRREGGMLGIGAGAGGGRAGGGGTATAARQGRVRVGAMEAVAHVEKVGAGEASLSLSLSLCVCVLYASMYT